MRGVFSYNGGMLDILFIALGMGVLIKGSDIMVDGAASLARRWRISELVIGLTIVAFGTSAPELVVSLSSAMGGHAEIAVGNVIGSNLFNLLMVLGMAALIAPIRDNNRLVRNNILFSITASVLLIVLPNLTLFGGPAVLSRVDGLIMLMVFGWFLIYLFRHAKDGDVEQADRAGVLCPGRAYAFIAVGLAALMLGGNMVVGSAVSMAQAFGISERIIALTIVAAGTSLPELVVSITAVLKKNSDIAIGNILGSNIFNILFALGLGSVIRPIAYSSVFNIDIMLLIFGTTLLFWALFIGRQRSLDRKTAAVFVMLYIGYLIYLIR